MKKFNKYNHEDLKIVAHEFHAQGEFATFRDAYDTICADYDKDGLSDRWLDFFFEKSANGPVAVFRSPERVYNILAASREKALAALAEMKKKGFKVKGAGS